MLSLTDDREKLSAGNGLGEVVLTLNEHQYKTLTSGDSLQVGEIDPPTHP